MLFQATIPQKQSPGHSHCNLGDWLLRYVTDTCKFSSLYRFFDLRNEERCLQASRSHEHSLRRWNLQPWLRRWHEQYNVPLPALSPWSNWDKLDLVFSFCVELRLMIALCNMYTRLTGLMCYLWMLHVWGCNYCY